MFFLVKNKFNFMYAVAVLHSYVVLSMAYFDCFAAAATTAAAAAAVASLRQWP